MTFLIADFIRNYLYKIICTSYLKNNFHRKSNSRFASNKNQSKNDQKARNALYYSALLKISGAKRLYVIFIIRAADRRFSVF